MSEQDNVRIVQEAYAAFTRGDVRGILERLTDDVDWFTPGSPDAIPYAGQKRGLSDVEGFFATVGESETFTGFEPREFIAQGDRVAAIGNYKGRVKASQKDFDIEWVHIFTFRDGKVASFREYLDTAALAEAHRTDSAQAAPAT
jgi:ketosteroid isomerase-like protein